LGASDRIEPSGGKPSTWTMNISRVLWRVQHEDKKGRKAAGENSCMVQKHQLQQRLSTRQSGTNNYCKLMCPHRLCQDDYIKHHYREMISPICSSPSFFFSSHHMYLKFQVSFRDAEEIYQ
jgi:hypothetical protein